MSRLRWALLWSTGAIALGASLVACGDDEEDADIRAELSDFKITVDKSTIAAGDVVISAKNTGNETHELIVLRTDLAHDQLPVTPSERRVDETRIESQGGEIIGEIEDVEKGKTQSHTFTLAAGKYVLFCNLPVHYEQGMHVALVVQ